jgi:ribonuclease R
MEHMGRKNSSKKKKTRGAQEYNGVLDITRSGMGYVIIEGLQKDILVRPADFNRAFHGDKVRIRVRSENMKSGRVQGEVIDILERKQTEFIGQVEITRDFAFFLPDSQKPMPDFFIPLAQLGEAKDGDRVIVRMTEWRSGDKNPKGVVVTVLKGENHEGAAC